MVSIIRVLVAAATATTLVVGPSGPALAGGAGGHGPATGPAPGAPGVDEQYLPADKSGFGTVDDDRQQGVVDRAEGAAGSARSTTRTSARPSARALEFVVADGRGHAVRAGDGAGGCGRSSPTSAACRYRQSFTDRAGALAAHRRAT